MIQECEFIQRMGNTVKMHLKNEDGSFSNHYHRYGNEAKAMYMYDLYAVAIERNGGCRC